jgi:hypothetical protein
MLGFFRLGSVGAALVGGLALVGAFGGCGPAAGTCSADLHSVVGPDGSMSATCAADESCAVEGSSAGCAKCDPTQCLQGNDCISGYAQKSDYLAGDASKKTTACRLKCSTPTDCPFNYTCVADDNGQGYCTKDRTPAAVGADYTPTTKGEPAGGSPWGDACDPTKGLDQNPDCDSADYFWCYGVSPTDGNAFCTQFQCSDDADCPGGWWCATVNDTPNVTTSKRPDWGTTTTVCLPRAYNTKPGSYCAPCKSDVDCPKNGDAAQHCVSADGSGGAETVCSTECQNDGNCPFDQKCVDTGIGVSTCVPRAGTCKGDGSLCSPCHSDKECQAGAGGYCVNADYSTEHFCTAPTPTCTYSSTTGFSDSCPKLADLPASVAPPNTTTDGIGCSYQSSMGIPLKQCYGGNVFGLGCYTFHCAGAGGTCFQGSDCCSKKCDATNQVCQ